MNRNWKRIALLALTVLLAVSVLAACAPAPTATTAPTAAPTTPADPYEKKVSLTWMMSGDTSAYKADSWAEKILEEKFNVDLNLVCINSWDEEKLRVTIAGGTHPDVFIRWAHQKYFEDGVTRELDPEMVKQYWPTAYNAIDSLIGPSAWEVVSSYRTGKPTWVPGVNLTGDAPWVTILRQDWMDNVGVTKMPETLDEFYALAQAFRNGDPDKNGKKDTYIYGGASDLWCWNYIWAQTNGAFGFVPNQWIKEGDKVINNYTSTRFKDMLKTYAKWYSEDLIDPEFSTDKYAILSAKFADGKLGADFNMVNSYQSDGTPSATLLKNNSAAKLSVLYKLTGPNGDFGTWSYGRLTWSTAFGANTTDEQMIRAMQMLEVIDTDMDLFKQMHWGEEGVDYTIDATGKVVPNPDVKASDKGLNQFISPSWYTAETSTLLSGKPVVDSIDTAVKATKILKNLIDNSRAEYDDQQDPTADFPAWFSIPQQFHINAITGKIDIDASWDAYVTSWNKACGQKTIDAVQTWPQFDLQH
jgi:putative aldouronate transport system substrate-binding protein